MSPLVARLPAAHKHKPVRTVGIILVCLDEASRKVTERFFCCCFTLKLPPIVGPGFPGVRFTGELNTIYWFNTLLFSYLCLRYELSNKLDFTYIGFSELVGVFNLHGKRNWFGKYQSTLSSLLWHPLDHRSGTDRSIATPPPPDMYDHKIPKVPLGIFVRQKQGNPTDFFSSHQTHENLSW